MQAIDTLRPVRWIQVRRNEIQSRQTFVWRKAGRREMTFGLDIASDRTQRCPRLLLADVAYVIPPKRRCVPTSGSPRRSTDQLRRAAVERGQCHERPYLGCREFVAKLGPPDAGDLPIDWTEDLGSMILSVYDEEPPIIRSGPKPSRSSFPPVSNTASSWCHGLPKGGADAPRGAESP